MLRSTQMLNTKIIKSGSQTTVINFQKVNTKATIKKIDANHILVLSTGEIKETKQAKNRLDNYANLRRSMSTLRDLINNNTENPAGVLFFTGTYANNMTDTKQFYKDFEKFIKRLRYYYQKNNLGPFEYITAIEPQGRGAWHCHTLLIHKTKAPRLNFNDIRNIWQHGRIKLDTVNGIDNIGAYLSAYLTDIKKDGKNKKGERLNLYPPNCQFYRYSRGIKKPETVWTTEAGGRVATIGLVQTHKSVKNYELEGQPITITYTYYIAKNRKKQLYASTSLK